MLKIINFLKYKNIFIPKNTDFFLWNENEDFSSKEGILILESSFFEFIPLTFPKNIDEREKAFEIERVLEEKFDNYEYLDYIQKDIILYSDEDEESILIILIKEEEVQKIFNSLKNSKIRSFFPIFFMEFFSSNENIREYIEITEEKFRIFSYEKNKLFKFQEIDFSKDELLKNPQYLYEYLTPNIEYFFYYPHENLQYYFPDIAIINFSNYNVFPNKDFNFLPKKYLEKEDFKKIFKIGIKITALILIFSGTISFLLNLKIHQNLEAASILQRKIGKINSNKAEIEDKIITLEKELDLLTSQEKDRIHQDIKLAPLFYYLDSLTSNIKFISLEYDNFELKISGNTLFEESIYTFEKNLINSNFSRKINHDFIKNNNNIFEFQIDIEVNYEKFNTF